MTIYRLFTVAIRTLPGAVLAQKFFATNHSRYFQFSGSSGPS